MKNIHILQTETKLAKLQLDRDYGNLTVFDKPFIRNSQDYVGANIYITSNKEIKKGDWCYHPLLKGGSVIQSKYDEPNSIMKKIILTTDQDLIKDGVQAIPDEFLQWFIKNPNCEFVEVNEKTFNEIEVELNIHGHDIGLTEIEFYEWLKDGGQFYKIIIPKEELKQEPCNNCNNEVCCCIIKKQETLEEDDETKIYMTINKIINGGKDLVKGTNISRGQAVDYAFNVALKTAKWQSERMYSEEEILDILQDFTSESLIRIKKWFEQFKKK